MANLDTAIQQIERQILGKSEAIHLAVCCMVAGGHLLIEDLPGMGKTTLSHALANTFGLSFSRVQFTSDILPADVLGFSTFDPQQQDFSFHPGPVFSQLVLADEINRASPKSQSALLEAMEEHQVSIDGNTYPLPSPFFVIATQNPLHHTGTYPLPESQLDRFLMRLQIGYPQADAEKAMLRQSHQPQNRHQPLLTPEKLSQYSEQSRQIHASDALLDYILRLVNFSRQSGQFPNALSPRASKALLGAARAWALIQGRDHVLPEDVQQVLPSVCEHRLRDSQTSHYQEKALSMTLLEHIDPLAA
ncbi:uncharacterized protein HMF8227_01025 [Saliniradius amylolyticus]|uniref:Uncharacterized protein n=1 Tax=Saliniradius amylolyticus TaxID=2183582 RepID=A0A2S2E1K3_9ALTE|nr:MoxR family ATPase [Saliniradius amylolyticus]AWL11514.1 uncharacterized protein HMF8227_01025 [Saliniradius amylolyticus]